MEEVCKKCGQPDCDGSCGPCPNCGDFECPGCGEEEAGVDIAEDQDEF